MSPCLFQSKGLTETVTLTIEVYGNCNVMPHLFVSDELYVHYSATKTSGYLSWILILLSNF